MNSYSKIAIFVSQFSVLAPLTLYLLKVKKVKEEIHSIGLLVIISAVCDLIGYILVKQKLSTAFVINAFFLFQFFLLSHYYYKTVFSNKPKTVLVITIVQYLFALVIVTLFYDEFREQHLNYFWAISSIILIVYSVLYFNKTVKTYWPPRIYRYGDFWINSAIFLYFTLSIWLFVIRTDTFVLQMSDDMYQLLRNLYRTNNILKNVLLAVGIFYSMKRAVKADILFEAN